MNNNNHWWHDFFDEAFCEIYLNNMEPALLQQTISFLMNVLNLKRGDLLFDQCCGVGTLAHAFTKEGIRVIGVDQSENYLTIAKKEKNPLCTFHRGDAFHFLTDEPCNGSINWQTSFGYLADDHLNINMLKRVYESLKPGGQFALDYAHAANDIAYAKNVSIYKKTLPQGELKVIRRFNIDNERNMRCSSWEYHYPNGLIVNKKGESRLYYPKDIAHLLKNCGFIQIRNYQDVYGHSVMADSARFITVGQKPLI